jgi:hypothetical protein
VILNWIGYATKLYHRSVTFLDDSEREDDVTKPEMMLVALIGLFSMAGGLFDWNWFMTNRRAWLFVKLLGRTGARVFYVLLGLGLIILGILGAYGGI